jgi:hypothetical protein
MTNIPITDIVLRTTSDGEAYVHGLAIGIGANVDQAVTGLMDEARTQVNEIERDHTVGIAAQLNTGSTLAGMAERDGRQEPLKTPALTDGHSDPTRYYEVADVRLTCDPDGTEERWVAYGTLRSTRVRPGSGGYWSADSRD